MKLTKGTEYIVMSECTMEDYEGRMVYKLREGQRIKAVSSETDVLGRSAFTCSTATSTMYAKNLEVTKVFSAEVEAQCQETARAIYIRAVASCLSFPSEMKLRNLVKDSEEAARFWHESR